jgi:hypothetical protein
MMTICSLDDLIALVHCAGSFCQVGTALIAATIGAVTYRYTRRQSALALIGQNNALANLVNTTMINSHEARDVFGKLQDAIVGCPDDAVLLMYLNYVHNTYRMHQIGAVSAQVWRDTLNSCNAIVVRLRREQVQALLSRGYEAGFQHAVLTGYDRQALQATTDTAVLTRLPRRPVLARAG